MEKKWINTQIVYPKLLINSSGYKMSYKVLIYRSNWERIDIGWLVMTPNGGKYWHTEVEKDIMLDEVDYWHELPEIPI